jgi:hypothetical protein
MVLVLLPWRIDEFREEFFVLVFVLESSVRVELRKTRLPVTTGPNRQTLSSGHTLPIEHEDEHEHDLVAALPLCTPRTPCTPSIPHLSVAWTMSAVFEPREIRSPSLSSIGVFAEISLPLTMVPFVDPRSTRKA